MKKVLLVASLLLSGCVTTQTITHETPVTENEGVVVADVSCIKGVSLISMYKIGSKAGTTVGLFKISHGGLNAAGGLICNSDTPLRMKVLPAGDYYFGSVYAGHNTYLEEEQSHKFTVKAGALNYVGDVKVVRAGSNPYERNLAIIVQDDSKGNLERLKNSQPELLEKYEYINAVAKR